MSQDQDTMDGILSDAFDDNSFPEVELSLPLLPAAPSHRPGATELYPYPSNESSELSSPNSGGSGSLNEQYSPDPELESYSQATILASPSVVPSQGGSTSSIRNSSLPAQSTSQNLQVKGTRQLTSVIHHHGKVKGVGPTRKWKCGQVFQLSGGTGKAKNHIKRRHPHEFRNINKQLASTSSHPDLESSPLLRGFARMSQSDSVASEEFSSEIANDLFVDWIVQNNLPFTICENEKFRLLAQYLNKEWKIPQSHHTIRSRIIKKFQNIQANIRTLLSKVAT
ncbi:hypothetical protein BDD12DRAFT_887170 [Trichophaea hybrida]|nr:hypothetical protein BDD12DRAFT_887170 [Trichophaea hybrida]